MFRAQPWSGIRFGRFRADLSSAPAEFRIDGLHLAAKFVFAPAVVKNEIKRSGEAPLLRVGPLTSDPLAHLCFGQGGPRDNARHAKVKRSFN